MSRFITATYNLTGELSIKAGTSREILFGFSDGATPIDLAGATVRGFVITEQLSRFNLTVVSAETFASSGLSGTPPATNELIAYFTKSLVAQIPIGTHRYELFVDFSPSQTWCPVEGEVQFRP